MYKVELPENDDEGHEQDDLTKRFIDVLYNLRESSIYNELQALKDEDEEVASAVLHLRNKILDSLSKFNELRNTYATTTFQIEPILSPELSKFYGIGPIDSFLTHIFKSEEIRREILYINQRAVMYLNQYLGNKDMPCSFQLKDMYVSKGKPYVELQMFQKGEWLTRELFGHPAPQKAEIALEVLKGSISRTLATPVDLSHYNPELFDEATQFCFVEVGETLGRFIQRGDYWHRKVLEVTFVSEEEAKIEMDIDIDRESLFRLDEVYRKVYKLEEQRDIEQLIRFTIRKSIAVLNNHFTVQETPFRWEFVDFETTGDSGQLKLVFTVLNDTLY